MVDAEVVERRLRELDRRVGELRSLASCGRRTFLSDRALQAQAERHLQLALQAVIDVALHLVAEETPEVPTGYGGAFPILAGRGILDRALADRLKEAAGLRNILVHGYLDVDPARIWTHVGELSDLERYAAAVVAHLRRS